MDTSRIPYELCLRIKALIPLPEKKYSLGGGRVCSSACGPWAWRNTGRQGDRLGMACHGRRNHQGPPWREKTRGPNPTDWSKQVVKRGLLSEVAGMPLGNAVAGANRHDVTLVEETIASIPIALSDRAADHPQGTCLD